MSLFKIHWLASEQVNIQHTQTHHREQTQCTDCTLQKVFEPYHGLIFFSVNLALVTGGLFRVFFLFFHRERIGRPGRKPWPKLLNKTKTRPKDLPDCSHVRTV